MIRNYAQLQRALNRLEQVHQQIEDLENRFSGVELEIFTVPLIDEVNELEIEIREYQELQSLSLEEAVQGPLKEPILLDNIGELLTKLRIAVDLTQQELATQLGWQQSNLSRFESENYHSQTIAKIIEYASSLGVWLHVSPSLTEEPAKITFYKAETMPVDVGIVSTSSESILGFETDSYSERTISGKIKIQSISRT